MDNHPVYAYRSTIGMDGNITWAWVEEAPQTVWVRTKNGARYVKDKS